MMMPSGQRRRVQVHVDEILENGIRVRLLHSNRTGFIRRREINWDRRIGMFPEMPKVGDTTEAVIVEDSQELGILYLSLRLLRDPWQSVIATQKYGVGESVEGEVVNVQHFAAFVQLEPGVDAVIWPNEVPMCKGETIEDALWVGDRVRGIVTRADLQRHEIELSIWDELELLDKDSGRRDTQMNLLVPNRNEKAQLQTQNTSLILGPSEGAILRFHPGISPLSRILVVDNEESELERICNGLQEKYKIQADGVLCGRDAIANLRKGASYDLALIDLRLSDGEHGAKVADQLREIHADLPVIYMSRRWFVEKDRSLVETTGTPLTSKDLDDISFWVDRLCNGYHEEIQKSNGPASINNDSFVNQLGMEVFARRELPEMLNSILRSLRRKTGSAYTLVLKLDRESRQVSILAAEPALSSDNLQDLLDRLYYSPVRNVIEDEEEFRRNDVQVDDSRFKNLFPHLSFGSCFGMPLVIPDQITQHALFLLHTLPAAFSLKNSKGEQRIANSRLSARFLAAAIEHSLLLSHMRAYQEHYIKGRIWADLTHELGNKVNGLVTSVATLQSLLARAFEPSLANERDRVLLDARETANEVGQAVGKLNELVNTYKQLSRGNLEPVDVNGVIKRVQRQLERTAQDAKVRVLLDLDPDLPPARAVLMQLEQILVNLMLNAIQQLDLQRKRMEKIGKERGDMVYLLQEGFVIVQTHFHRLDESCPIEIMVADTGPGIHWQQQQRIFTMGFTKREGGAGLGLFISRNLAEMSGGHLFLSSSLQFIGSAFVLDLSTYPSQENSNETD